MRRARAFRSTLSAVAAAGLLAACAGGPRPLPMPDDAAAATAAPSALETFEARQRARALQFERQGALAEAVLAWEPVALLHPDVPEDAERLAALRRRAQTAAAERLARAGEAAQRGDAEAAARWQLAALALDPANAAAADALRRAEVDRNQRAVLGRPSRLTLTRHAVAASETAAYAGEDRNGLEHATMLLAQGEVDEAIAIADRRYAAAPRDVAMRRLLADALARRAQRLADADRPAAIAALERSLQLEPKQPQATELRRTLAALKAAPVAVGALRQADAAPR